MDSQLQINLSAEHFFVDVSPLMQSSENRDAPRLQTEFPYVGKVLPPPRQNNAWIPRPLPAHFESSVIQQCSTPPVCVMYLTRGVLRSIANSTRPDAEPVTCILRAEVLNNCTSVRVDRDSVSYQHNNTSNEDENGRGARFESAVTISAASNHRFFLRFENQEAVVFYSAEQDCVDDNQRIVEVMCTRGYITHSQIVNCYLGGVDKLCYAKVDNNYTLRSRVNVIPVPRAEGYAKEGLRRVYCCLARLALHFAQQPTGNYRMTSHKDVKVQRM